MASVTEAMEHASGEGLSALIARDTRLREAYARAEGFAARGEISGVANGLGFSEEMLSMRLDTLSGGQKTRVALGRILLQKPDIVILDEPTNHLDMNSIRWLEQYLSHLHATVLVVSHDRMFLDRIVTKVVEIEYGVSTVYQGGYTAFAHKKEALRDAALRHYLSQQKEIKRQQEVIARLKSYNREKSVKRARSREKLLEKKEVLERPKEVLEGMRLVLSPETESGKDVLAVEGLMKAYGQNLLFSGVELLIRRGEKVALTGDNGTGKSTFLKILCGEVMQDAGQIRFGTNVQVGYYDQEQQGLHEEKTLFDEIADTYPQLTENRIRDTLAAFLFRGDDVFKQVKELSGGEKGRLSLAKLMLSNCNFLLLDEPTNHLDIASREILEDALNAYEGTLLYVSHDRYLMRKTATRVLSLSGKTFVDYPGGFTYFEEHREAREQHLLQSGAQQKDAAGCAPQDAAQDKAAKARTGKTDWEAGKRAQAAKRKRASDLQKCEEEIAQLEARDKEIDETLALPEIATSLEEVRRLSDEQALLRARLEELMEQWEDLTVEDDT